MNKGLSISISMASSTLQNYPEPQVEVVKGCGDELKHHLACKNP